MSEFFSQRMPCSPFFMLNISTNYLNHIQFPSILKKQFFWGGQWRSHRGPPGSGSGTTRKWQRYQQEVGIPLHPPEGRLASPLPSCLLTLPNEGLHRVPDGPPSSHPVTLWKSSCRFHALH